MEIVTSFLSDFNSVADWVMTTLRGFFRTVYGSPGNTLYLRQILFIVAALPGIIGFCVEIIFSFILSFRFRRVTIFIPWRYSSYDIVRHGSAHNLSYARNRMSIIKRGKIDYNLNVSRSMPLLSFVRGSPAYSKSNEVKSFVPRRLSFFTFRKAKPIEAKKNVNNISATSVSVSSDDVPGIVDALLPSSWNVNHSVRFLSSRESWEHEKQEWQENHPGKSYSKHMRRFLVDYDD